MIASYPDFHVKIVTVGSTSGSSKVNLENSELSFILADETAAVLQTTEHCRSQWATSLCFSAESATEQLCPFKAAQSAASLLIIVSLISQPQHINEPSLACREHPVPRSPQSAAWRDAKI